MDESLVWTSSASDRISDLPDSIIQHILSYLEAKDAIKTCVLSRRWESLWTSIPNLIFHVDIEDMQADHRGFPSFVDKTLMKYASSKLKKLSLHFYYDYVSQSQLASWVQFALDRNVEELFLYGSQLHHIFHKWPEFMLTNSSVTTMTSSLGLSGRLEGFCWRSLKVLTLINTTLGNETIRSILLGSPVMECLTLDYCRLNAAANNLSTIDVSGTSLKELVIYGHNTILEDQQIDISGPNLVSLTIESIHDVKLNFINVSSLVEANIDINMGRQEKMPLKHFIQGLSHVNKLTVGISCDKGYYSYVRILRARFPAVTRKILEIDMETTEGCLHALSTMLCNSPYLEQLTINLTSYFYKLDPDEQMDLEPIVQPFPNQLLKSIKITGLVAGSCSRSDEVLVELVQYLLANAKVLQKLFIHAEADNWTSSEPRKLFEIAQKLLSYPRASSDAVVLFEGPLQIAELQQ